MYPYGIFFVLSILALVAMLWPVRERHIFCMVTSAIFLMATFTLYNWLGNPGIILALDARNTRMAAAREIIKTESAHIKRNEKDLESWIRLGQAFAENENWQEAAGAFKQAVRLSGGQPDLIMAYAKSLIMAANGTVSDHATESLRMVLLQKPKHAEARYYMAVRTLQDGKTAEAMGQMKELYQSLPDDSPVKLMINEQIGRN